MRVSLTSLHMRTPLFLVLLVFFFAGCLNTNQPEPAKPIAQILNLPDWRFLANVKAVYASEVDLMPKNAYVFPALRLNPSGQPNDTLSHRIDANGELQWFSPAPQAGEIQSVIEKRLKQRGYQILSFQDLMDSSKDHSVLVFNPYFTEARPSKGDGSKGIPKGWSTFTRLTGSTFPQDLNPAEKQDMIQQETITLFTKESNAPNVVKRSFMFSVDHTGQNREWSESISLLE